MWYSGAVTAKRPLSPMVANEGVSGSGVRVGGHGGHAAVHVDPQRHVVTLGDRRFDVHHVAQEVNTRLPLFLPVL